MADGVYYKSCQPTTETVNKIIEQISIDGVTHVTFGGKSCFRWGMYNIRVTDLQIKFGLLSPMAAHEYPPKIEHDLVSK